MFLADQQKSIHTLNSNIKLLDLISNALKEWDEVVTLQDEYTAKFLEESQKYDSPRLSDAQSVFPQSQPPTNISNGMNRRSVPIKRPKSAFMLYKADCWNQIKNGNRLLRDSEILEIITERWRNESQIVRSRYEAQEQDGKVKYEQKVALHMQRFPEEE